MPGKPEALVCPGGKAAPFAAQRATDGCTQQLVGCSPSLPTPQNTNIHMHTRGGYSGGTPQPPSPPMTITITIYPCD